MSFFRGCCPPSPTSLGICFCRVPSAVDKTFAVRDLTSKAKSRIRMEMRRCHSDGMWQWVVAPPPPSGRVSQCWPYRGLSAKPMLLSRS